MAISRAVGHVRLDMKNSANLHPVTGLIREGIAQVDRVPHDAVLPGMPGFDRDYLEGLLQAADAGDENAIVACLECVSWVYEWIDAIPEEIAKAAGISQWRVAERREGPELRGHWIFHLPGVGEGARCIAYDLEALESRIAELQRSLESQRRIHAELMGCVMPIIREQWGKNEIQQAVDSSTALMLEKLRQEIEPQG
ncbi:hypothetical protein ACYPKM_02140 [Pseudomonas aeruginosa]